MFGGYGDFYNQKQSIILLAKIIGINSKTFYSRKKFFMQLNTYRRLVCGIS